MLPCDSKVRRDADKECITQTLVEDHYKIQKPEDKPVPYSDKLFREAAIQFTKYVIVLILYTILFYFRTTF